jgi:hypothetical protein
MGWDIDGLPHLPPTIVPVHDSTFQRITSVFKYGWSAGGIFTLPSAC